MSRHPIAIAALAAVAAALMTSAGSTAHHGGGAAGERGESTITLRAGGHVRRVETHADPIEAFRTGPRNGLAAAYPGPGEAGEASGPAPASSPAATCTAVERTTDNTADAFNGPPLAKVIYAHPSDSGSNRFPTYAPVIQAGVRAASDAFFLGSSDRSIRFDLGTIHGEDCLDIQTMHLPKTRAQYLNPPGACGGAFSPGDCTFVTLLTDVQAALGSLGQRNFLVYADWITRPDGARGQAIRLNDDDTNGDEEEGGPSHNDGQLFGVVYGYGGTDFQGSTATYPPGLTSFSHMRTVIHELTHTLGAVQDSAPHATDFSHCFDEWDLMCYADGGPFGTPAHLTFPCGTEPYSPTHEALDCGRDDYMSPNPAPGSYLATHWNTYQSVFLCDFFSATSPCAPDDNEAPDTTIYPSGVPDPSSDTTPTFAFSSVGEPAANFICEMDDGGGSICSSPWTSPALTHGGHTFEVRAIDTSNNIDLSPASREFTVDTVAPDTTVSGRHRFRSRKRRRAVRFTLGSNEPASYFDCRIDGGRWTRCAPSFLTWRLPRGRHILAVRATDRARLTDPSPATHTFRIVRRKRRG